MLRLEIAEDYDTAAARRTLLAARLFLEARFEERRTPDAAARGAPRSSGNCWAAARFLAAALNAAALRHRADPAWAAGPTWKPAFGWILDSAAVDHSHAFAIFAIGLAALVEAVALADQFAGPEIALCAAADDRWAVKALISGDQDRALAERWKRAWRKEAARWLALADARMAAVAVLSDAVPPEDATAPADTGHAGTAPAAGLW